jgi:hypothetical protein
MLSRKSASILTLILAVVAAVAGIAGYIALSISAAGEVSVKDINSNPQCFNNTRVRVNGYIVNTSCYMFGPKYVLRDNGSEIALSQKNGPRSVDLARYVSFIFDGENYTQTRDMVISVVGHVRYVGFVTDAPSCYIDVEDAELKAARWDLATFEDQQIRVEVEKTSYSVGEPVRFRVFNKNLSHEPIFAGVTNIALDISNPKGDSVFGMGCDLLWPSNFMVNPGEEIELHGVLPLWNQTNNQKVQVPPDAYTIKIEMDAIGGKATLLLKIAIIASIDSS